LMTIIMTTKLITIMIRTGATKAQIRPSWIEIQQLKIM